MRLYVGSVAVVLALLGNVALATSESQTDTWVLEQADRLVSAARAAYEQPGGVSPYKKLLAEIANTIEQRRRSGDEEFLSRHRQFVDYIETASLDLKPDHQLGFNVTDKQYFAETQPYVQIPDFLLNQKFLRWVGRYETLGKAKAFLASLNANRGQSDKLIFFSYRSRHLGTPDNDKSYRRLLIVVPGEAERGIPEKWVQFGVTDPKKKALIRNVSVVSALLNSDGTFNAYFKDYYRTYRRGAPIQIKGRWELGQGADNCAKCHKTGVLPIFPVDGSVAASEKQSLEDANNRFRTYGAPRFDKYLDQKKFGPGLAAANPTIRARRFGETFHQTNVAEAMNCARCHQDQKLGALNWPMSRTIIKSFVKAGQMPPGHNLSERDRDELYKKLVDEYFATDGAGPGILKSWLVGKDEDEGQVASAQLKPNETGEQYADHLEKWQEDDEATNDE
jgi:hypothetical protein